MSSMDTKDWVTVGATLLGPILAVQAQKWVERARAAAQRKDWVFGTLMATRQARISPDHVRALNMIDLAYYGARIPLIGWVWRTKREKQVLTAWHDYHAHLNLPPERRPKNEAEQNNWNGRSDELFTNLLDGIATANKFRFERNQLKGGSYSPEAHNTVELQGQVIRHLAIEVLAGNKPLPLEVKAWPVDTAIAEQQRNIQAELIENQRLLMGDMREILQRLTDHAVGDIRGAKAAGEAHGDEAAPAGR